MSQPKDKRMNGMTLGSFGTTPKASTENPTVTDTPVEPVEGGNPPTGKGRKPDDDNGSSNKNRTKRSPKVKATDKLTTVNIKIGISQQQWLADTARQVRDNNDEPVPPGDRVYPQHLIGVAIDLLKSSDVNWDEVQNIKDLRDLLGL